MRNLTICPTIERSDIIQRFVASFYRTQKMSDLIILTKIGSITNIINDVKTDGYDYVTITNDDFIFKTEWWDIKLAQSMKKPGFAYGFDGASTKLPTTCMIDTRITNALGWIQMPRLIHLCGDMVWSYLGQKLNNLYFNKDVFIEHNHFLNNKAEKDSVYEITNSTEMYRKDNATFKDWMRNESEKDIQRIKLVLCDLR